MAGIRFEALVNGKTPLKSSAETTWIMPSSLGRAFFDDVSASKCKVPCSPVVVLAR